MPRLPLLLGTLLLSALLALAATPPHAARRVTAATTTATKTPSPTKTPTPKKTPTPTKTPVPKKTASPTPSPTPAIVAVGPVTQPPMPALYYGSVTWLGAEPGEPLTVEAVIDGQVCGWEAVSAGDAFAIDVRNHGQQWGCGDDGETVSFRVNGRPANETATFQAGTPAPLQLTGPRLTSVTLSPGCATLTSSWPAGTKPETVRAGLLPAGALLAFWIWDTGQGDWDAYIPGVEYASSLTSVDEDDALWVCVSAEATYQQPVR